MGEFFLFLFNNLLLKIILKIYLLKFKDREFLKFSRIYFFLRNLELIIFKLKLDFKYFSKIIFFFFYQELHLSHKKKCKIL
jgi:hypothetical protein